jgi:arylsulfatase A-like enzyme
MLHYFIDAQSWDEYFPARETENPFPQTMGPSTRPVSLIRGGSWQYYETDWGPINATDKEYGGDYSVVEWVGKRLSEKREKPFFLACGIYRPHEPWFVPKKYFDAFPIDEIKLPPGYVRNDLEDIPTRGKQLARNRYFPHILKENQWKQGIQGYLASIHFADAMLGLLLDALENGPNADNTIVVLWSDHGWHLGEKEHWQKFTLWRACTRVPLIIRVPAGTSRSLTEGTHPSLCSKPVNLLSLAPTLFELCGLDSSGKHDGPSLVPLLENPNASWGHVSLTHLQEPGSYGLSEENWRYIKYANGEEELYNIKKDPFEWDNLASFPKYAQHLERLRKKGPTEFAKLFVPKLESLSNLKWIPLSKGKQSPPSNPMGHSFDTRFINYGKRDVELFWIDRRGNPVPYAIIKPRETKVQRTRKGAVWQISQVNGLRYSKPLGYFLINRPNSKGVIKFP